MEVRVSFQVGEKWGTGNFPAVGKSQSDTPPNSTVLEILWGETGLGNPAGTTILLLKNC